MKGEKQSARLTC